MRLAPLQLKNYFITHLKLEAQRQFDAKKPHLYNFKELQNTVNVQRNQNDPHVFQVSLALKQDIDPKANLPYAFNLQIIGIFEVLPEWPKNKIGELIKINGPAVLYSAAREILAQITGRGPWGKIMLPAVNFLPDRATSTQKKSKKA